MNMAELVRIAHKVLMHNLKIRSGDGLVIAGDSLQSPRLLDAFVTAGQVLGAKVGLVTWPALERQNDEPPAFVGAAFAAADAVVVAPSVSITHTKAVREARAAGTRVLVCSGLTEEMMRGPVDVDQDRLARETRRLAAMFTSARTARVVDRNGTDVTMRLGDRTAMAVDGVCDQPGQWNFIPAGTTALAPLEGTTEGWIVFDGSLAPVGILREPVRLRVQGGVVTAIEGGRQAEEYREFLASFCHPGVYNIAEIGVGTNPKASLSGRLIQDERILGSVHVGIGSSVNLGGTVDAPSHTDGVILRPTLYLDDQLVVEDGRIVG